MNSVCVIETEEDARSSQILRDEHKTESITTSRQPHHMCSQRPNILKATAVFLMCYCIYVNTFSSPVNPIVTYHPNFTFSVICYQPLTYWGHCFCSKLLISLVQSRFIVLGTRESCSSGTHRLVVGKKGDEILSVPTQITEDFQLPAPWLESIMKSHWLRWVAVSEDLFDRWV